MDDTLIALFNAGLRDELIAEKLLVPTRLVKRRRKWHRLFPQACTAPPWADALRRHGAARRKLVKLNDATRSKLIELI